MAQAQCPAYQWEKRSRLLLRSSSQKSSRAVYPWHILREDDIGYRFDTDVGKGSLGCGVRGNGGELTNHAPERPVEMPSIERVIFFHLLDHRQV